MMRMAKAIVAMAVAVTMAFGRAGDTAPFLLDTVSTSMSPEVGPISISWDASWVGGNPNATVVIADNGTEVKRATGTGEFMLALTSFGRNQLTYTTYIGGVAQAEVYTATVYALSNVVNFAANGGNIGESTRWVVKGSAIGMLPTPTRTGYMFAGWWTSASGGTQITASTAVTDHVMYYAHWLRRTTIRPSRRLRIRRVRDTHSRAGRPPFRRQCLRTTRPALRNGRPTSTR